jgi:hypothetical protein
MPPNSGNTGPRTPRDRPSAGRKARDWIPAAICLAASVGIITESVISGRLADDRDKAWERAKGTQDIKVHKELITKGNDLNNKRNRHAAGVIACGCIILATLTYVAVSYCCCAKKQVELATKRQRTLYTYCL